MSDGNSGMRWGSRVRRVLVAVGSAVGLVLALLGAYLLMASFALHGKVNPWSLLQSVSRAAGSAAVIGPSCERSRSGRVWTCTVVAGDGSGSGRYRVSVHHGSSCWDALRVLDQSEDGMPE
ncbi:MAG: hypothetical protein JWR85_3395 [Marmoricola sp.]|nr:hypothetical protein [Marmoricola sp.]